VRTDRMRLFMVFPPICRVLYHQIGVYATKLQKNRSFYACESRQPRRFPRGSGESPWNGGAHASGIRISRSSPLRRQDRVRGR
jgi:hypothetical protein